jgi:pyruvate,orthophosphate dikinase
VELVGRRGAGLAIAGTLGLPIPHGFTISTVAARAARRRHGLAPQLRAQLAEALTRIEAQSGLRLGDRARPLLLTVTADTYSPFDAAPPVGLNPSIAPADDLQDRIAELWQRSGPPTAITVHRAIRSDLEDRSAGTGIAFTRHPASGAPGPFGSFWPGTASTAGTGRAAGAAGADERLPLSLAALADSAAAALGRLNDALHVLEVALGRVCAVSFAVEAGGLVVLDVRAAETSPVAATRFAVESVDDMLLEPGAALERVPVGALEALGASALVCDRSAVLAVGLGLSRGAAIAPLATSGERVVVMAGRGERPILVAGRFDARVAAALELCAGLLLVSSQAPAEAAQAGQRLAIPVVSGVQSLAVDRYARRADFPRCTLYEGEMLAIDGASGLVATGGASIVEPEGNPWAADVVAWSEREPAVPIVTACPPGRRGPHRP